MINPIVKTIELRDGRTITLETGKLAKQADGAVMLRMGNTMLLATVCAAKDAVPGTDFMPLQVEYRPNARERLPTMKSLLVVWWTAHCALYSPTTITQKST